jgi:drug/metabolite transporter (DMT)-like permease
MSGVLLMIGNSLSTGGFLGNIVALVTPISFAVLITIVRKYPNVDMVPAMFIAAFLSAMYASFLVNSFYISPKDLLLSFLLGTFQIGFGFICITIGSKSTPAAIVGILMLVEAILGPIWAWIFINETPPLIVIIGGAVIMFSILFQSFFAKKTT